MFLTGGAVQQWHVASDEFPQKNHQSKLLLRKTTGEMFLTIHLLLLLILHHVHGQQERDRACTLLIVVDQVALKKYPFTICIILLVRLLGLAFQTNFWRPGWKDMWRNWTRSTSTQSSRTLPISRSILGSLRSGELRTSWLAVRIRSFIGFCRSLFASIFLAECNPGRVYKSGKVKRLLPGPSDHQQVFLSFPESATCIYP